MPGEGYDSWGVPDFGGNYYLNPGAGLWIVLQPGDPDYERAARSVGIDPAGAYVGPPAPPQPADGPTYEYPETPTDQLPTGGRELPEPLPGDSSQPIVIPGDPGAGPPGDSVPAYPPWDPGEEPAPPNELPRIGGPNEPTQVPETGIIHHPYETSPPGFGGSLTSAILPGELTFPTGVGTQSPGTPPAPLPPPTPRPGLPSGGWAWDEYAKRAARAMKDTAIRKGARAVGRRLLGPIGVIIDVFTPNQLGNDDWATPVGPPVPDDWEPPSSVGEDIARGAGIIGVGTAIGVGVIIDEIGRLPPALGPLGDDQLVRVDVPRVDIPAPVISQPAPLPIPEAPSASLPYPSPSPSTAPTTPRPGPSRTTSGGTPTGSPVGSVPQSSLLWSSLLSSLIVARNRNRSRSNPWPSAIPGLTSSPLPFQPSPLPSPLPALSETPLGAPSSTSSPFPTDLTAFQPSVSSSAPPRVRTPTRTRECHCDSKPKKRRKPRECAGRGQLVWATGPKKGKAAGSRCYSFRGGNRK